MTTYILALEKGKKNAIFLRAAPRNYQLKTRK